jgi:hypothetical protein
MSSPLLISGIPITLYYDSSSTRKSGYIGKFSITMPELVLLDRVECN